jgi:hypothetical protein
MAETRSQEMEPAPRKKRGPPKGSGGRPSKYTPELATEIVQRLSEGEPLRQICRDDHMPDWRTIYDWMYRNEELSAAIAHARELGQDAIAEDIMREISEDPERILSEGGGRIDSGYVQLIKARAEIKLKLLAKWNPKKYGDRTVLAGDAQMPVVVQSEATEELKEILKNLELRIRSEAK